MPVKVFKTKPDAVFKFREFLCEKDRKLFDEYYKSLEGKTIYIRKQKGPYNLYIANRNKIIKQRFSQLRNSGKKTGYALVNMMVSLPEASNLSEASLRKIVYSEIKKAAA